MKLYEHPEFADAIKAAKQHFAHPWLTEQFIEKDYYITEALRIGDYPTWEEIESCFEQLRNIL